MKSPCDATLATRATVSKPGSSCTASSTTSHRKTRAIWSLIPQAPCPNGAVPPPWAPGRALTSRHHRSTRTCLAPSTNWRDAVLFYRRPREPTHAIRACDRRASIFLEGKASSRKCDTKVHRSGCSWRMMYCKKSICRRSKPGTNWSPSPPASNTGVSHGTRRRGPCVGSQVTSAPDATSWERRASPPSAPTHARRRPAATRAE